MEAIDLGTCKTCGHTGYLYITEEGLNPKLLCLECLMKKETSEAVESLESQHKKGSDKTN